jgi:site-specific DNA-methyltransferase (adenine-specific)
MKTNVLYYGDNLDILRRYIPDESVDLVYLDPPFNSNATYNVIFRDESGRKSDAQLMAFDDTWHWGPDAEAKYAYLTNTAQHQGRVPNAVGGLIAALRQGINPSPMLAYVVEMAVRLLELHRVLKPTGSLYLHCDPTASHYLKLVLDAIFGPRNFRNEIVWRRSPFVGSSKARARFFPHNHDVLLVYTRSDKYTFNPDVIPYTPTYVAQRFKNPDNDPKGPWQSVLLKTYSQATLDRLRRDGALIEGGKQLRYKFYLSDSIGGRPRDDVWTDKDVAQINPMAKERLGYPTQKPVALLERIIAASSNPGDIVLDPFCGCGTALVAAQKLDRRWIGIDVTYLAIAVMKARLKDSFGLDNVPVIGQPTEVEGARQLAQSPEGRYQFQWWALDLVGAQPVGGTQKKGADRGIDGVISFSTGPRGEVGRALVSVKSGAVNVGMVRDLKGVLEREKAEIGLFITLEEPTAPMRQEAASAGLYHSELSGCDYPRIQLLTIRELLEGLRRPELPRLVLPAYQQAERVEKKAAEQAELFGS